MTETAVIAIIVAVIGIFGGAGLWQFLIHRQDRPIKKRDADIAAAHASQQMALASANDARESAEYFRAEVELIRNALLEERDKRRELDRRLCEMSAKYDRENAQLRARVETLAQSFRMLSDAWDRLEADWNIIRTRENPPVRPITPED